MTTSAPTVPVGVYEIAALFNTTRKTVDTWRDRYGPTHSSPFPAHRWMVGNRPAWDRADLEAWAAATGRMIHLPG